MGRRVGRLSVRVGGVICLCRGWVCDLRRRRLRFTFCFIICMRIRCVLIGVWLVLTFRVGTIMILLRCGLSVRGVGRLIVWVVRLRLLRILCWRRKSCRCRWWVRVGRVSILIRRCVIRVVGLPRV